MAIEFRYKPVKARQLAAAFLRLAHDRRMNYNKLIKLMYLADRERLLASGSLITGDRFMSLPFGPVLSTVLDCIRNRVRDQDWLEHFRTRGYDICMIADPGDDELSRLDDEIVLKLYNTFQDYDWKAMIAYCHEFLPEWQNPGASNFPIDYGNVLAAIGKSREEIQAIEALAAENLSIDYCLDMEDVVCV